MEELIKQICEMVHAVTEVVFYFRRQNHAKAYEMSKCVLQLGETYFDMAVKVGFSDSVELLLPIWKSLLAITEAGDEVQLADIYEQQLLPALYDIQNCLIENTSREPKSFWETNMALLEKKDQCLYQILKAAKEDDKKEYAFDWSCTGDPVLWVGMPNGRVQLCSAINPWQEALCFSEENVTFEYTKYIVMGFGLGYHIETMAQKLQCKEITVIENDLEQLRIAVMYRDLTRLLRNDKVHIVYCKETADYSPWLGDAAKDKAYVVWYPSIKTISEVKLKEAIEDYWVSSYSMKNTGFLLEDNFYKNLGQEDENVDVLRGQFAGKSMVLVAGGPSLDDSMEYLRRIQGSETKIVCVGKVAAKLIKAGIRPDYLIMIDAKLGTQWQIRGIEETGVPLIYLSTVASTVVENYKGRRYIAFQKDFAPAECAAKEQGVTLFQTGGSVATFALDLGIRFGCKKILCVGLDLGYPGDHSHAQGVGSRILDKKSLRQVESVSGEMIYTSKTLDMYRKWIENRIKGIKDVELINASKGARIHGMKEQPF